MNLTAPLPDAVKLAQTALEDLLRAHPLTTGFTIHPWESREVATSPCIIVHVTLGGWEMRSAAFGIARLNCLVRARVQADAAPGADPAANGWSALFDETQDGALWTRLNLLTTGFFWNWISPAEKSEHRIAGRHFETDLTWQMKCQRTKPDVVPAKWQRIIWNIPHGLDYFDVTFTRPQVTPYVVDRPVIVSEGDFGETVSIWECIMLTSTGFRVVLSSAPQQTGHILQTVVKSVST